MRPNHPKLVLKIPSGKIQNRQLLFGSSCLNDHLQGHFGHDVQGLMRRRMGQLQTPGAQGLGLPAQGVGKGLRLFVSVLGISQDGKAHISAVDPELMGPAGDGPQRKFT